MVDRPVLRYHGGKFRLAPWVISHFPPHECYVEPFAGAASVLMQKPRAPAECLNDLDDIIVGVFRVLRDPVKAEELRRRLVLTPFARTEFLDAYHAPADEIDAARKAIALSFMGQGSDALTRGFKTGFRCALRNRDSRGLPSHEWADYPDVIPHFVERLQGVAIENTLAVNVMRRLDARTTLHYVDPPYPFSTRSASRSKHGYRCEMTDEQHRELAQTLRELTGMVIISGYPCALYEELFEGWMRTERPAQADRGAQRTEVLWINPRCRARQLQMALV